MDEEARDTRTAPANWREYLRDAKETGELFRWVWRVIPEESRARCRRLLALFVVQTVASLSLPRFVGILVDGAAQQAADSVSLGLLGAAACLIIARLLAYALSVNREWILGVNWGAVDRHITERFFEKSVGQHIHESSRLAVSNIDKGRWRLIDLQAMLLFEGVPAVLSLAIAYVFLWTFLPAVGMIMTVSIAAYLAWTLYLNRQVMVVCTPLDAAFRKLNRYRVERWEKVERVKTSTRSAEEVEHTDSWFTRIIAKDRAFWVWFIKQDVYRGGVNSVCLLATLGYACLLVWQRQWSAALLLPLFSWSMQLTDNIWRVGHVEHQLNWNAPSVRSMIDAVSLEPDIRAGDMRIDDAQPIVVTFDAVGYQYPLEQRTDGEQGAQTQPPVLNGVSFTIGAGEKVALLGESGAGKTTVMRLLLRYMDPTAGAVSVQGRDLRRLDLESWWGAVGYIPQQAQVLDGTLRDNLTYALPPAERERITDAELWELMRLLKIDFGARLTQGLDTLVGRHGLKLSGGQAQRLMIGAAAVKKPRFMIIDEATSSLDSTTEKQVQRGLREVLKPGVGALVVAHRLSTVRHLCSRFIVLRTTDGAAPDEPQIEAVADSFEELYETSLVFRRLADDQGIVARSKENRSGA